MRLVVLDGPAAGATFVWPGPAIGVGEGTSPDLPPFGVDVARGVVVHHGRRDGRELGYQPNPYAVLVHDLVLAHCGVAFYSFRSGPERRAQ